jgi:hypothetical protein
MVLEAFKAFHLLAGLEMPEAWEVEVFDMETCCWGLSNDVIASAYDLLDLLFRSSDCLCC